MEFVKLIPQVFFDVLARYVPGLVLLGGWIVLLAGDGWSRLLNQLLGGEFDSDNALPTVTLVMFFVPFAVGYVIAPLAKLVQRGNERGWWLPKGAWVKKDKEAGDGYDWLRANQPIAGALAAKIRAEFTMHNSLSVAFLGVMVMAGFAGEPWWALACGLAVPLMARRGADVEETFHSTTRKLCLALGEPVEGILGRAVAERVSRADAGDPGK